MLGTRNWLQAAMWPLWLACAAPPPPAAEHPRPPPKAAASVPKAARCRLVRRAERTWVGFAEGMTLDDMLPAGEAAAEIVHALDAALCALRRGEPQPALRGQAERLHASAAHGGGFEVTKVLWQDTMLSRAEVELHAQSAHWLATVVLREERWQIAAFNSQ